MSLAFVSLVASVSLAEDCIKDMGDLRNGDNGTYVSLYTGENAKASELAQARLIGMPFLNVLSSQFTNSRDVFVKLRSRMMVMTDGTGSPAIETATETFSRFKMMPEILREVRETTERRQNDIAKYGFVADDGGVISMYQLIFDIEWTQNIQRRLIKRTQIILDSKLLNKLLSTAKYEAPTSEADE